MDSTLGNMPGTRLIAPSGRIWTVRSVTGPPTRIVVVSGSSDGEHGMVIDHAALLRMVSIERVERAVEREERIAAPGSSSAEAAGARPSRLTARERDVLALMALGRSNSAIADRLVISPGAVEKHVANIFMKLQLPTSSGDNRRVLAVLHYLDAVPRSGVADRS